jgi:hypothetical protein
MAGISPQRRATLPRGSYVYGPTSTVGGKGRKSFPIDTKARARNALARAGQSNNAATYGKVEKAVNRKWPDIQTKNHTPKGK